MIDLKTAKPIVRKRSFWLVLLVLFAVSNAGPSRAQEDEGLPPLLSADEEAQQRSLEEAGEG